MSQNTSTAVMQRRVEPHDSLDDYPTPPWATRALLERLDCQGLTVREPAANRGHMVKPLSEYFDAVIASDIHDYGHGYEIQDYLFPYQLPVVDWTITNPPFRLAQEFIDRALATSRVGCAVIVRTAFLEGISRYSGLFKDTPPTRIMQFCERVVMHRGKLTDDGSSATCYCWLVWKHGADREPIEWIEPCRKRLELESDYAGQELTTASEHQEALL